MELPRSAAWRHRQARIGFEVLFTQREENGLRLEGYSTAVEGDETWSVHYTFLVDASWRTRSAHVVGRSSLGAHGVLLEGEEGEWRVNGRAEPALSGCLDVDLEASAATNALPVARLALAVGDSAEAPAAYVRASDASVERMEQTYTRLPSGDALARYAYVAPSLGFSATIVYDELGLVVEYPGIAVRVA